MEYETPKRDNVVPGADFSSNATGQSGERVRQIALSMGSAMKSATGTSLSRQACYASSWPHAMSDGHIPAVGAAAQPLG